MNTPVRLEKTGETLYPLKMEYWIIDKQGSNCYVIAQTAHLRHAEMMRSIGYYIWDPTLKEFI